MKWIIVLAIMMACLVAVLIKSTVVMKTEEESAVRPGQTVETYPEHVTSEYLRAKAQIRQVRKKQEEPAF